MGSVDEETKIFEARGAAVEFYTYLRQEFDPKVDEFIRKHPELAEVAENLKKLQHRRAADIATLVQEIDDLRDARIEGRLPKAQYIARLKLLQIRLNEMQERSDPLADLAQDMVEARTPAA
jgi:hypothetical protein